MTEPFPPPTAAPPAARSTLLVQAAARARLVQWAMYVVFAVLLVEAGIVVWQLRLLGQLRDEGATADTVLYRLPASISDETVAQFGGPVLTIASALVWFGLAAGVLQLVATLRWVGLARAVAELSGAVNLRYGRVTSVLAWLVPIWNLFGPKQIVNDLWIASDPRGGRRLDVLEGTPAPWLLGWWLPVLLVPVAVGLTSAPEPTVGGLQFVEYLLLTAVLGSAASGVVLIRIVRTITARQVERAGNLGLLIG